MVKKFLEAVVKSTGEGIFEVVASSGKTDRLGDTIDPKGWYLKNYRKNPVILWSHMTGGFGTPAIPPVARADKVWVEDEKELKIRGHFADTPFAQELKALVEGGFLNAVSVGFIPLVEEEKGNIEIEGKMYRRATDEEIEKNIYGKEGEHFSKQELLEVSWVNVPALATALVSARKMNLALVTKALEEEIKGVIPYKEAPKAPEDADWNAGEELKKATGDAKRLRTMHAWVDSGNPDFDPSKRKWYKLPHQRGDGNQAVVWRGVAAAMAVLLGARGGVDVPAGDKKGIYNHLAKHYKQFGKEPPEFKEYSESELQELFGEFEAKPYPNEHACRLEDPGKYKRFRRKNCEVKHDNKCIDVIYGVTKEDEKAERQSLRYDKKIWTEASAKAHCKDNDGTFEAASEESSKSLEQRVNSFEEHLAELEKAIGVLKENAKVNPEKGATPAEVKGRKQNIKKKSDIERLLIIFDKFCEALLRKLRQ